MFLPEGADEGEPSEEGIQGGPPAGSCLRQGLTSPCGEEGSFRAIMDRAHHLHAVLGAWCLHRLPHSSDEESYSDLYRRVCEGLSDSSKVIAFGFKGVSPRHRHVSPSVGTAFSTQLFPGGLCHHCPRHR
ncbi:uncharacterized protein LOC134522531 isoform X2 [Chroicocephalus ridibundus]|uniref:uncharacterized protein LOC134522531 isoform X2 n=1 Tax=Chroicocephalus ridibundus TaxID=1192867 RepID=UPI002FDEB724